MRELALQKSSQEEEIEKIRDFLEQNGISLELSLRDENYVDYMEDKIVVHRGQPHKQMIYTALHEIGHYFSEFIPEKETPASILISEVLAWDLGKDIGHTLGIDIDEEAFNSLMIKCVEKYLKYYSH